MRENQIKLPHYSILGDEETKRLLALAQKGDAAAREKLVNGNLRLVYSVAQRFINRGRELEDLFQVGAIGLLKAIGNFDAGYEVCFSTYAVPMIMGEIRRYIRDDDLISISRSLKENAVLVKTRREQMQKEQGREPTVRQLAESLGLPLESVVTALESAQAPASIHDVVYQDDGEPIYLLDHLSAGDEHDPGRLMDSLFLEDLLRKIPPRLKQVVELRYLEDKTQAEVAAIMGVSQVQVSRLEKRAFIFLRRLSAGEA
ncbi:MAG: SigB/SigF/SigG family RNA polymerase sigma factor [Clostridiales bacterium]|nr:SigB/SigF/SigG family RNA polymerase sigma factor [Clostridiales bacterium]